MISSSHKILWSLCCPEKKSSKTVADFKVNRLPALRGVRKINILPGSFALKASAEFVVPCGKTDEVNPLLFRSCFHPSLCIICKVNEIPAVIRTGIFEKTSLVFSIQFLHKYYSSLVIAFRIVFRFTQLFLCQFDCQILNIYNIHGFFVMTVAHPVTYRNFSCPT